MKLLQELWYGNLEPVDFEAAAGKEHKEAIRLVSRNEEKLLTTLSDEQKELFTRYADSVREYQSQAQCLLFQTSFRMGARIMLEVMQEE